MERPEKVLSPWKALVIAWGLWMVLKWGSRFWSP